jgi:hypothetical protein
MSVLRLHQFVTCITFFLNSHKTFTSIENMKICWKTTSLNNFEGFKSYKVHDLTTMDYCEKPIRNKMYWSGRAAIIDYCRLGDLNKRNLFLHNSIGWMSEINVSAVLFPLRSLSLAYRRLSFLMSSHILPSVCASVLISSYKDTNRVGQEPTIMALS